MEEVIYTVDEDFTLNVIEDRTSEEINEKEKSLEDDLEKSNCSDGDDKMTCTLCGYCCKNKTFFLEHIDRHRDNYSKGRKSHKCRNCNFMAPSKISLSMHRKYCVLNERKLMCPHCNFRTIKHRYLMKHIEKAHSDPNGKINECRKCSFKTTDLNAFKQHKKMNHKNIKQLIKL